jgi:hypothetical protein
VTGPAGSVSRQLVEGVDADGNRVLYVIEGHPSQGYDVFRCHLIHVRRTRRKWEAVKVTTAGQATAAALDESERLL